MATNGGVKKKHTPHQVSKKRVLGGKGQTYQYSLARHADRKYVFDEELDEESLLGHAIILTFDDLDFRNWHSEHPKLAEAFRSIQCSVITRYMNSRKFERGLKRFLDKRFRKPRIICIWCHGSEFENELWLCSGPNSIQWSQIVKIVAPAQVDVLFLINCCHAGSAYISHEGSGIRYAKVVISFAGCNQYTYQTMIISPLSEGMRRWFREATATDLSGSMLYEYVADAIRDARENGPECEQERHNHPIYRQRCDRPQSSLRAGKPGTNGAAMNWDSSQMRQWRLSRPMTHLDTGKMTPEVKEVTLGVEEMLFPPRRKHPDLVGLDEEKEVDERPASPSPVKVEPPPKPPRMPSADVDVVPDWTLDPVAVEKFLALPIPAILEPSSEKLPPARRPPGIFTPDFSPPTYKPTPTYRPSPKVKGGRASSTGNTAQSHAEEDQVEKDDGACLEAGLEALRRKKYAGVFKY